MTWKITALAPRDAIRAVLVAHEDAIDWDPGIVIAGSEAVPDRPEEWRLEAWLERRPTAADKRAIAALFSGAAPALVIDRLPEIDWVTLSQQAIAPIRAGAFHVRTPDHPPASDPGIHDLVIPASQAFGTGQHETTAGCLAMLTAMRRTGVVVRNFADVGTGSGILAFAALDLWPRALATASDIDPVCLPIVEENAVRNGLRCGADAGALLMAVAPGMDDPLIEARGAYDLVMANILAGPLIELAPTFAGALLPGGHLLLAGLLTGQEAAVRRACRRAGLRLAARITRGDWAILWLRKRRTMR